jgi:UDP-N-acetylmuramoyl-tripeptide--D-alanyl-D-alanine ligase
MKLALPAIAQAAVGILSPMSREVATGISTDTRTLKKGDLFVPLKGPNFNGHDYIKEAFEKGAVASFVEDWPEDKSLHEKPLILVQSSLKAFQQLANTWRSRFSYPVLGLTGSVGKTTTKNLIQSILSHMGRYYVSEGNLNNHIGVPINLMKLESDHAGAVIEMGMNHQGEIQALTKLAEPTGGLITKIGEAHIEFLGSKENIFKAKKELFDELKEGSTVFVNMDDEFLPKYLSQEKRDMDVIRYGLESDPENLEVWADQMHWNENHWEFQIHFKRVLSGPARSLSIKFPSPGKHQVSNALAAAAAARYFFGCSDEAIQKGLESPIQSKGRCQVEELKDLIIVDDSYNANPTSLEALLELGKANYLNRPDQEVLLVIGEMGELGEHAEQAHRDAGRWAVEARIPQIFSVGRIGAWIDKGIAESTNSQPIRHYNFETRDEMTKELGGQIQELQEIGKKPVLLVKGSRAAEMDRVVSALRERFS